MFSSEFVHLIQSYRYLQQMKISVICRNILNISIKWLYTVQALDFLILIADSTLILY